MDEERTGWFDDDPELAERPRRGRRLRLLLVGATVPWAVIAVFVVRGGTGTPPATSQPEVLEDVAAPALPEEHDPAEPGPGAAPTEAAAVAPATSAASPWAPLPHGRVGAVAAIVARAWLTGIEPVLSVDGLTPNAGRYVEHLVVEAVEQPTSDSAVVAFTALVLEIDGEVFLVRARRLAVPLAVDGDDVRPAGEPWWLPEHELRTISLPQVPIEDEALQLLAAEAVTAAGYDEVELVELARTDGWPWLATVRASTPAGARVDGTMWLREAADGFVVVGVAPEAGDRGSDVLGGGP